MSSGSLSSLGWIGTAKDDIETACIAPQFEKQISLSNLNATQNCTATAVFLSSLGWITGPHNYTAKSSNNTLWLEFLSAALPLADQNLTDLELLVYRNYFLASENDATITNFLEAADSACENDICEVQGYTGNPDIAGIGVSFRPQNSYAGCTALICNPGNRFIHCRGCSYHNILRRH
jgi:hypothetical protein